PPPAPPAPSRLLRRPSHHTRPRPPCGLRYTSACAGSSPTADTGDDLLPLPIEAPLPPLATSSTTERLLRPWVAGRKPTTIRTYHQDAADFAAFIRGRVVGAEDPVSLLLRLPHGEANGLALSYRADLIERRR